MFVVVVIVPAAASLAVVESLPLSLAKLLYLFIYFFSIW